MQPTTEFLTPEECAEVDKALLTSREKFSARVAIYALRSLKQIAQTNQVPIETLQQEQIEDWIYQDESLQQGIDSEFKKFFSQLVISSIKPLKQSAQEAGVAIENLTVPQVVSWFEKEAKLRLEQKN
jgi:antitoxin component of RelBE/YafQ-DinJ toxin-antitoxin module